MDGWMDGWMNEQNQIGRMNTNYLNLLLQMIMVKYITFVPRHLLSLIINISYKYYLIVTIGVAHLQNSIFTINNRTQFNVIISIIFHTKSKVNRCDAFIE